MTSAKLDIREKKQLLQEVNLRKKMTRNGRYGPGKGTKRLSQFYTDMGLH